MFKRPFDVFNAVAAYLPNGKGAVQFHGIHVTITGRIQEMPKFELVSYFDKKQNRQMYVNRVSFKIRSHKVSKKIAYITRSAEEETWTDKHQNTYFRVNVYDQETYQFILNNKNQIVQNQQVTVVGFLKKSPKISKKDGLCYPNFGVNAQDVIFTS